MENNETVTGANFCTSCKGTKVASYNKEKPCRACDARGDFPEVDLESILNLILAKQGKNKGKPRASMTAPWGANSTVETTRAYYVWRLARFHGGLDVTMPVMADMVCNGDPFKNKLDAISQAVAKRAFGSDMVGAMTWAKALGY